MSDVTRILCAIEKGDPRAAEELLPLVYEELRRLAAQKLALERPGQTLQATALVHEAYIRLVDAEKVQHWNSRGHFFVAAAEAMRRILINRARDGNRLKRGKDHRRIDLSGIEIALSTSTDELLALDEAMQKAGGAIPGMRGTRQAAVLRRIIAERSSKRFGDFPTVRRSELGFCSRVAASRARARRSTGRFSYSWINLGESSEFLAYSLRRWGTAIGR
jgi:RNA polymerase sigma factor (TIGR02999 family)